MYVKITGKESSKDLACNLSLPKESLLLAISQVLASMLSNPSTFDTPVVTCRQYISNILFSLPSQVLQISIDGT
jgi:hypothetical protein